MKNVSTRVGLGFSVFALALGLSASALAAPAGRTAGNPQRSAEHGAKHERGDRAEHTARRG